MNQTNGAKNVGVINQLHNMLTNHPERKHHVLKVDLYVRKGTSEEGDTKLFLVDDDEFEIYTNHPEKKIRDKIEKLRLKGGIPTIKILSLEEEKEGHYLLELEV